MLSYLEMLFLFKLDLACSAGCGGGSVGGGGGDGTD